MPYYDHDKDYPFAAFITNLGKYNEGELVGEWVKFPTTAEELKEVFKRIGIGQKDDFGQPYEEWFITDYDCYVDGLYSKLGEYENLDELNYLALKLDEMSESEYAQFQAGMEMGDHKQRISCLIPGFFLLCAPGFDCCAIRLEVDFRNRPPIFLRSFRHIHSPYYILLFTSFSRICPISSLC